MNKLKTMMGAAFILASTNIQAATFNFTGSINYHNDIVTTHFTVDNDTTGVRVWTDSFMDGINFDPITALWDSSGNLIMENDDDDTVNPGTQTMYDSGFTLDFLAQGTYTFTVATYDNWANGLTLAEGFLFDAEAPIALADWNQPANSINMGPNYSVWIDGVDSAVSAVPEPSTYALMLGGLGFVGFMASRRRKQA